ncbi:unnamed protein product [Linum trigynum]|uniref:Uncharacterized protein n=1 Tax=Linum trigynum TaxID=586398 RepID=A0AAV2D7L9_9ROSI
MTSWTIRLDKRPEPLNTRPIGSPLSTRTQPLESSQTSSSRQTPSQAPPPSPFVATTFASTVGVDSFPPLKATCSAICPIATSPRSFCDWSLAAKASTSTIPRVSVMIFPNPLIMSYLSCAIEASTRPHIIFISMP